MYEWRVHSIVYIIGESTGLFSFKKRICRYTIDEFMNIEL